MIKKRPEDDIENEMTFEAPDTGDDVEVAEIEEDVLAELKKYKEKLKVSQKERNEYLDGWQRSKADYLNQKRRMEEDRKQENVRNAAYFVEKLLPLCDSFDLALKNLGKKEGQKSEWHVGIEQIYNQLRDILKSYNVEILTPLGLPFDPHFHEAVSEMPVTDPTQHNVVLDVLQNGYAIGERLVRPAKVVVGR